MRILNMQLLAILAVTGFVAGSVSNVSADDRTPASQTGIEQVGHKTGGGGEYYCPPDRQAATMVVVVIDTMVRGKVGPFCENINRMVRHGVPLPRR